MDRKKFIKKGIIGMGTVLAIPSLVTSCKNDDDMEQITNPNTCSVSPTEIAGPFPIKTPTQLVRENIVGNRTGVPLLIQIKVENTNNNCMPLEGVLVDLWHCDAKGNYSEYSDQLDGDFTSENFLRGRQTTGADGIASFISIYPGWYPGRAPHLHLEILRVNRTSLLVTQTAFPEDISSAVYATNAYNGNFDTSKADDFEFQNSLDKNIATSVVEDTTNGYTLKETIKVSF